MLLKNSGFVPPTTYIVLLSSPQFLDVSITSEKIKFSLLDPDIVFNCKSFEPLFEVSASMMINLLSISKKGLTESEPI